MASGPITSRQTEVEKVEVVSDFLFLGFKITADSDSDCSHEIKKCFLLGRKAVTNLDSILKRRYSTLWTKVHTVKAMVVSAVMYGCEFSSVAQSFLTLCNPLNYSTLGFLVYHQLLELAQTHVH